ncbi:hypothetical protein HPB51_008793 [Rhipicephalus microplus]|uniref:Uncharacterized protein n=1 Tax=Rhipicephalus microplus TaxID=6941 RepID=A0A9J6F008_RHIMP|nr:hypothetical protein HPB51_008793 [Rhipicephalus microplus]
MNASRYPYQFTQGLRTLLMRLEIKFSQYVPLRFSQTTQVPEELQSCVQLLARTYRYGTLSFARCAVSRDTSERTSYNNPERAEDNLEARWPQLRVKPRADYFEMRNTLLISPSLVSFLFAMLIGLDPLVVPVLGSDVVRALLNAVVSSHQSSNVGTIGEHGSAMHSASLSRRREEATCRLLEQYAKLTADRKA